MSAARSTCRQATQMRRIDVTDMHLVHYGRVWPHAASPCSKGMTRLLERDEGLVFWLQPNKGSCTDQIPAIKIKDAFYSLSLRMMKAIWRNVRLHKDFHNTEHTHVGGLKLRIPSVLLNEKLRTQTRFSVSIHSLYIAFTAGPSRALIFQLEFAGNAHETDHHGGGACAGQRGTQNLKNYR